MPLYEYRCRQCDTVFEDRRPMSQSDAPATCPAGHPDARRVLSVFASVGRASGAAPSSNPGPSPMAMGGGCGAGCGCH